MASDYAMASTAHLEVSDTFERVYEPQEDSWLFCDALAAEFTALNKLSPSLIAEIGPGSGIVSTTLLGLFASARSSIPACVVADINFQACEAALSTAAHNLWSHACLTGHSAGSASPVAKVEGASTTSAFEVRLPSHLRPLSSAADISCPCPPFYDAIAGDLLLPMLPRLAGKVDVLLFNPPYVPTEDEEVPRAGAIADAAAKVLSSAVRAPPPSVGAGGADAASCDADSAAAHAHAAPTAPAATGAAAPPNLLAAAWAGGDRGRRVIDRALPLLPLLLSQPRGVAYMILVEENNPAEIAAVLAAEYGLKGTVIARTKAKNERLCVMRIRWQPGGSAAGSAVRASTSTCAASVAGGTAEAAVAASAPTRDAATGGAGVAASCSVDSTAGLP